MGGGSGQSSTTKATIAPELKPLFAQTGSTILGLQPDITGQSGQFFGQNAQSIPGFNTGQQNLADLQMQRAFGSPFSDPEQMALNQIGQLDQVPFGQLPTTQAAMAAARTPVLNELALAGLGNSDAVGTSLAGAFAPIMAQEMAFRQGAIPMLANIGNNAVNRQTGLIDQAFSTQEQARGIEEARGAANLSDLLRRQGLFSDFTTGILSGFPSTVGSKTSSSGGGTMK